MNAIRKHLMSEYRTLESMIRRFEREGRRDAFPLSASFPSWQKEARATLSSLLGLQYLEKVKPEYEEISKVSAEEGITRIKASILVEESVRMPFYILIPESASSSTPIIIAASGHLGGGKEGVAGIRDDEEVGRMIDFYGYDYGFQCARSGFVSFCFDTRGFGERREWDEKILDSSCFSLEHIATSLGMALEGLYAWDVMRLIDYIVLRGEWNIDDIRMIGFSGGGMQTLYASALDERIKLAFISGYFYGFKDSLLRLSNNCSCNYIPSLWRHFDVQDIAAMIAPRPLVIQSASSDHLNGERGIENVKEPFKELQALYKMLGSEERLRHDIIPGGHHFDGSHIAELMEAVCLRMTDERKRKL